MSRVALNAFVNELEKIAEAESTAAKAIVGAAMGGAATNILMSPIAAAILYKFGPQAAAGFVAANTLKGMAVGGIGGAMLNKKAAAYGEGSTRTSGWSSKAGGWATEYRSAGMRSQKAQTTNIGVLKAGLPVNAQAPGAGKVAPVPGAGPIRPAGVKAPKMKPPPSPSTAKVY